MRPFGQLGLAAYLARSRDIGRRYFVVNGFDGALTMLGLITGFELAGDVDIDVILGACVGTAVALGVSGLTSAYLSEAAERRRALAELEGAMVSDLSTSAHGVEARRVRHGCIRPAAVQFYGTRLVFATYHLV